MSSIPALIDAMHLEGGTLGRLVETTPGQLAYEVLDGYDAMGGQRWRPATCPERRELRRRHQAFCRRAGVPAAIGTAPVPDQ